MGMLAAYVPVTTNLPPNLISLVQTQANGDISTDGLTYTLHLRTNLKFEDGTPINSSTLKYSWDRAVKLNGLPAFLLDYISGAHEYFGALKGGVATVIASAYANYTAQGVKIVDA